MVYNPPTAVCPRHINVYNWVMFYGHSRLTTPGMHVWRMTTVEKLLPQCWAGRDDEELQFLGLHAWLLDNLEHLGKPVETTDFILKSFAATVSQQSEKMYIGVIVMIAMLPCSVTPRIDRPQTPRIPGDCQKLLQRCRGCCRVRFPLLFVLRMKL